MCESIKPGMMYLPAASTVVIPAGSEGAPLSPLQTFRMMPS